MKIHRVLTCGLALLAGGALAASHEDETVMAKSSKITLQQAMTIALAQVPGRVLWSARENFDGGMYVMVEIIPEDRSDQVVTIEAGTGKVVKVYLYAESGFLLYGIEVSSRVGKITLAKVDAGTGRMLATEKM